MRIFTQGSEKMKKRIKPIGNTIWLKIVLTIVLFIPAYAQVAYDPAATTDVIAAVMSNPFVIQVSWLLPIFKLLLLAVVILSIVNIKTSKNILIVYYAFILLVVGIFQNMANTEEYGFVILLGNILVQFIVLAFLIYDIIKSKTKIDNKSLNTKRLWIIPLMLLAFLMPYAINSDGNIYLSFSFSILFNEAGVTYCMITPVVIGLLLLYSKGVDKATLSVISYVGFAFGLLNMMTWFIMNSADWWMGVLHLPLLIIAFYGLITVYKEKTNDGANKHARHW